MSHELQTPLNGVLGYAQLLRNEGSLNAGQAARVDSMLTAGRHLVEMINSVLDLSEIEAGHAELRQSSFDVAAVAAACMDSVRPAAAAKELELILTVGSGVPKELFADRTRLRQVLLNLLGNAVKFTERGSVIKVVKSPIKTAVLIIWPRLVHKPVHKPRFAGLLREPVLLMQQHAPSRLRAATDRSRPMGVGAQVDRRRPLPAGVTANMHHDIR